MRSALFLALLLTWNASQAATPAQMLSHYTEMASKEAPGFSPSARRGEQMFRHPFARSPQLPSCTTCHTQDPRQAGRHEITGKAILPLAVVPGSTRFTDLARTEKWFGRNCREVLGRECTAAEKADLIAYLSEGR